MDKRIKILITTLLIFTSLLTGCAIAPKSVDPSLIQGNKIVVVPVLYEELWVRETGATALNNWSKQISQKQWNLNNSISEIITPKLSKSLTATVLNDPSIYDSYRDIKEYASTNFFEIEDQKESIKKLALNNSADIVLLVVPILTNDVFFNTNQFVRSHGVYQRSFFGPGSGITYVTFGIFAYDGMTGDELAIFYGTESKDNSFTIKEEIAPPEELVEQIREDIIRLYDQAITRVLREMNLS